MRLWYKGLLIEPSHYARGPGYNVYETFGAIPKYTGSFSSITAATRWIDMARSEPTLEDEIGIGEITLKKLTTLFNRYLPITLR